MASSGSNRPTNEGGGAQRGRPDQTTAGGAMRGPPAGAMLNVAVSHRSMAIKAGEAVSQSLLEAGRPPSP